MNRPVRFTTWLAVMAGRHSDFGSKACAGYGVAALRLKEER